MKQRTIYKFYGVLKGFNIFQSQAFQDMHYLLVHARHSHYIRNLQSLNS